MENYNSARERLLDPLELDDDYKSAYHSNDWALSKRSAEFIRKQLKVLFTLRPQTIIKLLLPSFALASTREQHAIKRSKLRASSYMDGFR
jgi:hypothetical protein